MNSLIKDLIKTFEPDSKNTRERYKEFLYHCYMTFDKMIKYTSSDKIINKYNIMRDNTLKYLIANEKKIALELSR